MKIPKGKKRKVPVKEHTRKISKGTTTVKKHTRNITQKELKSLQINKLKLLDRNSRISDSMQALSDLEIYETDFDPNSRALPTLRRAENLMEVSSVYDITYRKKFDELEGQIAQSKKSRDDLTDTIEELTDIQMKDIRKTQTEIKEIDQQIPRELVYQERD